MVFVSCPVLLLLFTERLLDVIQCEAFILTDYLHIGEQLNQSLCFFYDVFFIIAPHRVITTHSKSEQTVSMPFVQVPVRRISELQFYIRFLLSSFRWNCKGGFFTLFSEVKRLCRNPSYWNGVTLLPRLRLLLHFFLTPVFYRKMYRKSNCPPK